NRGTILVASSVHPDYQKVMRGYVQGLSFSVLQDVIGPSGVVEPNDVRARLNDDVACLVVQYPNFFGCLEDLQALAELVHATGALLVVVVNPIALGLLIP